MMANTLGEMIESARKDIMASNARQAQYVTIESIASSYPPGIEKAADRQRSEALRSLAQGMLAGEMPPIPESWVRAKGYAPYIPMEERGTNSERARILSWLESMKPGTEPYSKPSAEFERQASMRMWERLHEAVQAGQEPPKPEPAHLAAPLTERASPSPTGTIEKQTPEGLTTVAAIGEKWGG